MSRPACGAARRLVLVAVAAGTALGLGGCRSFRENCHAPQEYQKATSVAPLKSPEGLAAPSTKGALKIPDVAATARARSKGDPCLDEPPSFYPDRPKPGGGGKKDKKDRKAPAPAPAAEPAAGAAPAPPPASPPAAPPPPP
jgi:hypothetical protein